MPTDERGAAAGDLVARAHTRLLADHSLQFQFSALRIPPPPPWLEGLVKALKGVGQFMGAVGPVVKIILWVALAAFVAWILFLIARAALNAWRARRKRGTAVAVPLAETASLRPAPQRAQALLEEADRLAAQQRFEEAAHVLLFRTIADLESRRPRTLRPALTSRDIGVLAEIPAAARAAFGIIAERVEYSFFGGRSLNAGDFSICRAAYTTFASPASWALGVRS